MRAVSHAERAAAHQHTFPVSCLIWVEAHASFLSRSRPELRLAAGAAMARLQPVHTACWTANSFTARCPDLPIHLASATRPTT